MICQRCLNGVAASVGGTRPSSSSKLPRIWRSGASRTEWTSGRRRITSSHRMGQRALSTATPTQQTSDPSALAQATATSPSGAQISSTSAGSSQQAATTTAAIRPKKAIRSSAPAGQPLRGLNYMKNQNDPVALPDSEYPAWLWTCLEPKPGKKDDGAKGSSDKAGRQMRFLYLFFIFFLPSSAHRATVRVRAADSRVGGSSREALQGRQEAPRRRQGWSRDDRTRGAGVRAEHRPALERGAEHRGGRGGGRGAANAHPRTAAQASSYHQGEQLLEGNEVMGVPRRCPWDVSLTSCVLFFFTPPPPPPPLHLQLKARPLLFLFSLLFLFLILFFICCQLPLHTPTHPSSNTKPEHKACSTKRPLMHLCRQPGIVQCQPHIPQPIHPSRPYRVLEQRG